MILAVAPEMRDLGLSTAVLIAHGVDNTKTSPELLAYRRVAGRKLAAYWGNRSISDHPAIREYHRVHELFGVSGEPTAPEKIILYVRRNRDFTATGALIDCYNIVSARTLLSVGAHDLAQLELPITLRRIAGNDLFQPLGSGVTQRLEGEFGYVDTTGYVICRRDVLQCEWSKLTKKTTSVAFFIQANQCLSVGALLKGSWLLAEMVERFCGGEVELVHFLDAGSTSYTELSKPETTIGAFKRLNLETATVLSVTPICGFALSAITVQTNIQIDAVAVATPAEIKPGERVLVATGLHPLVVAGRRFTAYLPIPRKGNAVLPPTLADGIPAGRRLH